MHQLTRNMKLTVEHHGGQWVATVLILCCPMRKAKGLPGPEQAISIVGRDDTHPTMALCRAWAELRTYQIEMREFCERHGFSPHRREFREFFG